MPEQQHTPITIKISAAPSASIHSGKKQNNTRTPAAMQHAPHRRFLFLGIRHQPRQQFGFPHRSQSMFFSSFCFHFYAVSSHAVTDFVIVWDTIASENGSSCAAADTASMPGAPAPLSRGGIITFARRRIFA